MKTYTKIVLNMDSWEVVQEISYDYIGEVAECKGGGGGGGQSGKVDYPAYMKTQHETWLTAVATDIDTARLGDSPYFAAVAYDPSSKLANMDTAVCAFNTVVDALNHENDWDAAMIQAATTIDTLISDTYINEDVAAYAAIIDDQTDNVTIPKFQRGMQDINAVQSSAFAIGGALIYGMRDRNVAKYTSELRLKLNLQRNEMITNSASLMLQALLSRVEFEKAVTHYTIEANRMAIAATKDQTDQDFEFDELDAKWDLEMFQYGGNMMASIAGSATSQGTPSSGRSQTASAIGGGLSGAAAGAMVGAKMGTIGGLPGMATGAVIGGILGIGTSFL
jgi:hypothetical protein